MYNIEQADYLSTDDQSLILTKQDDWVELMQEDMDSSWKGCKPEHQADYNTDIKVFQLLENLDTSSSIGKIEFADHLGGEGLTTPFSQDLPLFSHLPEGYSPRRSLSCVVFDQSALQWPNQALSPIIEEETERRNGRRNSISSSCDLVPKPYECFMHIQTSQTVSPISYKFILEDPAGKAHEFKPGTPVESLRRHSMSSTSTNLFCCPWIGCQKVFNRFYNLRSHFRIHSGEKPYICTDCETSFARNHDLKRHQRIHSNSKPFMCSNCSKSFARNDAMTRHVRLSSCTRSVYTCSSSSSFDGTP